MAWARVEVGQGKIHRPEHRSAVPVLGSTPGPHMQGNPQLCSLGQHNSAGRSSISSAAVTLSSQSLLCSLSGWPCYPHHSPPQSPDWELVQFRQPWNRLVCWHRVLVSLLFELSFAPTSQDPCSLLEPVSEAAALSVASPGVGPLAEGFGEPSRKDHTEPYRVSQRSGRGCWEPGGKRSN